MNLNLVLFRVARYLRYWLFAVDEHSLQSPFAFDVYTQALKPAKSKRVIDPQIEALRRGYSSKKKPISADTHGAGSSLPQGKRKQLDHIAKWGISSRRQSEILVNLIEWMKGESVLELGTSLGLNAAYLGRGHGVDRVVTVEGSHDLLLEAKRNLEEAGGDHVNLVHADIDEFLLKDEQVYDMIYIDANHTYDATIRYFKSSLTKVSQKGVIVIDDINWSVEMQRAWNDIKSLDQQILAIENDKLGMVFVNVNSKERHYVLQF